MHDLLYKPCRSYVRFLLFVTRCSAVDAPNRAGKVFTFEEFKTLLTTGWNPDGEYSYPEFVVRRFIAFSFLLGAMRSVQMDRFREGGLAGCRKYADRDASGFLRPMVVSTYTS